MATRLTHLELDEVSAVDSPANKSARVVLLKAQAADDDDATKKRKPNRGIIGHDETGNPIKKGTDMDDKQKVTALEKKIDFLEKRSAALDAISDATTIADLEKAEKAIESDDVKKAVASKIEKRREAIEAVDKAKAADEFREKLSPAMQKAFDDMDEKERERFMSTRKIDDKEPDPLQKALEAEAKKNEALAEKVARLEAAEDLRKVRDEIKDLDGFVKSIDETAEDLHSLRKTDRAAADRMLETLRATAQKAREGGLFKVLGRDGTGDTPSEKIDKAVKKYRETHADVTEAQAMAKVLEENPELYTEYLGEKEAG